MIQGNKQMFIFNFLSQCFNISSVNQLICYLERNLFSVWAVPVTSSISSCSPGSRPEAHHAHECMQNFNNKKQQFTSNTCTCTLLIHIDLIIQTIFLLTYAYTNITLYVHIYVHWFLFEISLIKDTIFACLFLPVSYHVIVEGQAHSIIREKCWLWSEYRRIIMSAQYAANICTQKHCFKTNTCIWTLRGDTLIRKCY